MHNVWTAERDHAVALLAVEDEGVASRSPARVLITAPTQQGVEALGAFTRPDRVRNPLSYTRARASSLSSLRC